jgi:hypothetical protein
MPRGVGGKERSDAQTAPAVGVVQARPARRRRSGRPGGGTEPQERSAAAKPSAQAFRPEAKPWALKTPRPSGRAHGFAQRGAMRPP